MNFDVIYWVKDMDIYIHATGMCYDPATKVFFKRIDPINGDLRSIYYIRQNGDFAPARNGPAGKHNKSIFEDKTWDQSKIFSVKTLYYKSSLPKLFKEKVIELSMGL